MNWWKLKALLQPGNDFRKCRVEKLKYELKFISEAIERISWNKFIKRFSCVREARKLHQELVWRPDTVFQRKSIDRVEKRIDKRINLKSLKNLLGKEEKVVEHGKSSKWKENFHWKSFDGKIFLRLSDSGRMQFSLLLAINKSCNGKVLRTD